MFGIPSVSNKKFKEGSSEAILLQRRRKLWQERLNVSEVVKPFYVCSLYFVKGNLLPVVLTIMSVV